MSVVLSESFRVIRVEYVMGTEDLSLELKI